MVNQLDQDQDQDQEQEYRVSLDMIAEVYSEMSKKLFSRRIRKFVDHLREHELSLNHYSILFLVHHGEGYTSNQLCAKLKLKAASVSYLIDSLEKRGLIAREENPDDRRSQTISLTEQGRKLLLIPEDCSAVVEKFKRLSPSELEVLYLAMRLINNKWQD